MFLDSINFIMFLLNSAGNNSWMSSRGNRATDETQYRYYYSKDMNLCCAVLPHCNNSSYTVDMFILSVIIILTIWSHCTWRGRRGKRTVITRKISQPLPKVMTPPQKQVSPPPLVVTEGTEQELSNLMQQTNDAKVTTRVNERSSLVSMAMNSVT